MDARSWGSRDNSNVAVKRDLREKYVGEVEGRLAFDLFCGTGTFTQLVYLPRFEKIVCVDQKKDSLDCVPDDPKIHTYHGDNCDLGWRMVCRYGFPDFIDLDAYGNPDSALLPMLVFAKAKERFAVVATDGTMYSRKSFNQVPKCWGHDKAHWAPFSILQKNYPVLLYRHVEQWFDDAGFGVEDFDCYSFDGGHSAIYYWGALAVKK